MNLEADVFTCAKGTTHTAELQAHLFLRHRQAVGDLFLIFMQPLGCYNKLNSCAIGVGVGKRRFKPKEGLILHTYLVFAFNDDVASGACITVKNALMTKYVSIGVDAWSVWIQSILNAGERRHYFIVHNDGV